MKALLFQRIDNSPLIIFRIFFGLLVALECFGAIVTGWVRRTLVEPQFTFNFIGFEWLQPLPGGGMYYYFALMGFFGLAIMLGYRYRLSIISFCLMWTAVYLMQKSAYNNHYYLLVLISAFMCLLPAAASRSLDARRNPDKERHTMPAWCRWIFIAQLFIVYTYAAIAKLYTDWLDFSFISLLMESRGNIPIIGEFLQQPIAHSIIGGFGILFDFLVIPMLLWKPTRKIALVASFFFHLFNSVVLQIGIFPYLSLAFIVFCYPPETIRRVFFPSKPQVQEEAQKAVIPKNASLILTLLSLYFVVQIALPLRHHFIAGDVLWTEEGHRLSWRMMLRNRRGISEFKVVDKVTGKEEKVLLGEYLSPKQQGRVGAYPDFIWQFAQRLKAEYAAKGVDVSVYVNARVRINRRPFQPFIDPETDLAAEPWDPFRHHRWILPRNSGDLQE